MAKPVLTFKVTRTTTGNVVKVATITGTLKRLSEQSWSYNNASGDTISYKLANIAMTDDNGVIHNVDNVVVYEASYDQGMEVGEKYLGRVTLSKNEDGSIRKPWTTLSSYVGGNAFSEADFADEYEVWDEVPEVAI